MQKTVPTQPLPTSQPTLYFSYLIRIWRDHPDAPWRVSAQSVQSGKTQHFATIDALSAFLNEQKVNPQNNDSKSENLNSHKGETT